MKFKQIIATLLAAGLLAGFFSSQSLAANHQWSGYLGKNQWTAVSRYHTKTTASTVHPKATWTGTEGKKYGCQVAVYN